VQSAALPRCADPEQAEIFVGKCASKFDEKTGELKDETTRSLIKQQLEAFASFIERHGGRA